MRAARTLFVCFFGHASRHVAPLPFPTSVETGQSVFRQHTAGMQVHAWIFDKVFVREVIAFRELAR